MSIADAIPFVTFCEVCNKISAAAHDKKKGLLETFIEKWKAKGEELKKDNPNLVIILFSQALGSVIYPFLHNSLCW